MAGRLNITVGKTTRIKAKDSDGVTVFYQISTVDIRNGGRLQVPTGSKRCRIVKKHEPTWKRQYIWEGRKVGGFPKLPDPDTGDPNEVWNDGWLTNRSEAVMIEGTQFWVVSGIYEYLLYELDDYTHKIAKMPHVLNDEKTSIQKSDFMKGLLRRR